MPPLKVEVLSIHPFLEIWLEVQTPLPPAEREGVHTMACLATHSQSDTVNLKKTFVSIYKQKINFIPHVFLEILQMHENFLFWVLWACLAMHTQNNSINL